MRMKDNFETARRKRASSARFQRLCEKSREWQKQIDERRRIRS